MFYCIAVFRSRTHAIGFVKYMRAQGVDCSAINTPTELNLGCGLSAKFARGYTALAKQVIDALSLTSFRGFFSIRKEGVKQFITML